MHGTPKRYLFKLQLQNNSSQDEIYLYRYGFRIITRLDTESFRYKLIIHPYFCVVLVGRQ